MLSTYFYTSQKTEKRDYYNDFHNAFTRWENFRLIKNFKTWNQGFLLGLGEDTRRPSKGEKCTAKAIYGENFLWMLFYIILYLCDLHYTLLYHQFHRYLVSLYQIIWTFTDP